MMVFDWQTVGPVLASVAVAVLLVLAVAGWRALVAWSKTQQVQAEIATIQLQDAGLEQMRQWAHVAVQAAEQMLKQSTGAEKLDFVLTILDKLFPALDEDVIRAVVEQAVLSDRRYNPPTQN